MVRLIIHLIGILAQAGRKSLQGPDCPTPGINLTRHVTWVLCRLGISRQLVQQLRGGSPKKPFNHRTHTRLRRRAVFFRDKVPREQRLKVDTPELWATINKALLRQALVALYADPQRHHY